MKGYSDLLLLAKDELDCSGDDTLLLQVANPRRISAHGICLSRSSLPVRENTDIVAIQERLHQVLHLLIDVALARLLPKNIIKIKQVSLLIMLQFTLLRVWGLQLLLYLSEGFSGAFVSFEIVG